MLVSGAELDQTYLGHCQYQEFKREVESLKWAVEE